MPFHYPTQSNLNPNSQLTFIVSAHLQMSAQGQSWQKDAADQNFDYMFKLLIIGNSSVGKTRQGTSATF